MIAVFRRDGLTSSSGLGSGPALAVAALDVPLAVDAADRLWERREPGGRDLLSAVDARTVVAGGERAAGVLDTLLLVAEEDVGRRLELLLEGLGALVPGMVVEVGELAAHHALARAVHRGARAADLLEAPVERRLHLLSIEVRHGRVPASGTDAEYVASGPRRAASGAPGGGNAAGRPAEAPGAPAGIGSRADAGRRCGLRH